MKMKYLLGIFMIFLLAMAVNADEGAEPVLYDNAAFAEDTAITIDGSYADWADVESVNITLQPARDEATTTNVELSFKSVHSADKIYFLLLVEDDFYFYNYATGISHRNAPALGIAFPIDEGAKSEYMGGTEDETDDELNTTTGMVDIMHWELDVEAGVKTGGSKGTADKLGDGVANLDDEYSNTPWDRHDDNDAASNNLWEGAWSHTGDMSKNGSAGWWVFELSRDLTSTDKYDASFAEGETAEVAIAYWSPNETTENKWTDDGHLVNSHGDLIQMALTDKTVGAPGFELYLSLLALFLAIPILRKRK